MSAVAAEIRSRRPRVGLRVPATGTIGAAVVIVFVAAAIAAPYVQPYDVHAPSGPPLAAPSSAHLLGTNDIGQDVLSQLLLGTRVSLLVGVLAGVGMLTLGAVVGLAAGWIGGRVDMLMMRFVDLVLVLPRLPLLVVVAAYVGSSLWAVAAVIAATSWPPAARVVRSQVLTLRSRGHLRAARGFGARSTYVLRRHVIPELTLILAAGLVVAVERAIVLQAGLAFLGLGDPLRKSWGSIMRDAVSSPSLFFTNAWEWWLVPPVAALCLLLLGLTLVGIGLEQRINPRLVRHLEGGAH